MIPSIRNLYYVSPDDAFDHHFLFDLVTRCVRGSASEEALEVYREVIIVSFEKWSFETVPLDQLSGKQVTGAGFFKVLCLDERGDEREALTRLLRSRVALCDLTLSWDSVLQGHPILTPFIRDKDEREIVAKVSDKIIDAARNSRELAQKVDDGLVRLYGNAEPSPISVRDLAGFVPAVAELNALYDAMDFAAVNGR